jgi:polynucleotide 5'-kinase involved in rRNA processing
MTTTKPFSYPHQHEIIMTEAWLTCMNEICNKPTDQTIIVAIVGPKGVGKSTFAKELFSKWQKERHMIGFLDTDLGRPEFTFPGMVSFHLGNDNFVEKPTLKGALYLGEDDPSQRPEDYLQSIQNIAEFSQRFTQKIIVNTHGWFSGLGQDVLEAVLLNCKVTDVIQIVPETKLASLGSLLRNSEGAKYKTWTIPPAKESRHREAKATRERKFVDYFLEGNMHAVGLNKVKIRYPKDLVDRDLPPNYGLLALNASLVGLMKNDDNDPQGFIGIGLVTAIDIDRQLILVQSKLTFEEIKQCQLLIPGTTSRVPLNYFPSELSGDTLNSNDDDILQDNDETEKFLPYLTSCKMVGFGLVQHKGNLKRRRLDEAGGT